MNAFLMYKTYPPKYWYAYPLLYVKKSNTNKSRLSQSPVFVLGALATRFSRLRRGLVGFAVDL